jgi:lipid A 4'-phosphatase
MFNAHKFDMKRFAVANVHCFPGCISLLVMSSLLFTFFPQFDLWFSKLFYAQNGIFPANDLLLVKGIYFLTPWLGRLAFIFAIGILLLAIFWPAKVSRRHWRRAAAAVAVVVLGIGLLVHTVLKDGMGRPRPRDVQVFHGSTAYVPVLVPSQYCPTNCSFVSGHAAVGFALMSVGMWGARRRRQFWLTTGIFAGCLIGLARIAQGGHFLSDVVFSLVAIWSCHLLIREIWLRFRVWQFQRAALTVSKLQQIL